jgi:AcrR family transcriptional regulator
MSDLLLKAPVISQLRIEEENIDPRAKRTRQLLVQAFTELLGKKEFQAITVQDIAERATVNRATFYAHFEDKYALLNYVIRENFQKMLASRFLGSCVLNEENLKRFMLVAFEFLEQFHSNCSQPRRNFDPLIESQVQVLLYEALLDHFKHSEFEKTQPALNLDTTARTLSWAIFGVSLEWSTGGSKKVSAEEMVDQMLRLFTNGLAVPK